MLARWPVPSWTSSSSGLVARANRRTVLRDRPSAHGGKIAEENRFRSPVARSVRLSLTRGTVTSTAPALVSTSRGS